MLVVPREEVSSTASSLKCLALYLSHGYTNTTLLHHRTPALTEMHPPTHTDELTVIVSVSLALLYSSPAYCASIKPSNHHDNYYLRCERHGKIHSPHMTTPVQEDHCHGNTHDCHSTGRPFPWQHTTTTAQEDIVMTPPVI